MVLAGAFKVIILSKLVERVMLGSPGAAEHLERVTEKLFLLLFNFWELQVTKIYGGISFRVA